MGNFRNHSDEQRVAKPYLCQDGGQWRITGLGRNGVTLNGTPLIGPHVLSQGDSIRWGRRSDALMSRVEIG